MAPADPPEPKAFASALITVTEYCRVTEKERIGVRTDSFTERHYKLLNEVLRQGTITDTVPLTESQLAQLKSQRKRTLELLQAYKFFVETRKIQFTSAKHAFSDLPPDQLARLKLIFRGSGLQRAAEEVLQRSSCEDLEMLREYDKGLQRVDAKSRQQDRAQSSPSQGSDDDLSRKLRELTTALTKMFDDKALMTLFGPDSPFTSDELVSKFHPLIKHTVILRANIRCLLRNLEVGERIEDIIGRAERAARAKMEKKAKKKEVEERQLLAQKRKAEEVRRGQGKKPSFKVSSPKDTVRKTETHRSSPFRSFQSTSKKVVLEEVVVDMESAEEDEGAVAYRTPIVMLSDDEWRG